LTFFRGEGLCSSAFFLFSSLRRTSSCPFFILFYGLPVLHVGDEAPNVSFVRFTYFFSGFYDSAKFKGAVFGLYLVGTVFFWFLQLFFFFFSWTALLFTVRRPPSFFKITLAAPKTFCATFFGDSFTALDNSPCVFSVSLDVDGGLKDPVVLPFLLIVSLSRRGSTVFSIFWSVFFPSP